MNTLEILNMTHQELLNSTNEVRAMYREAVNQEFHNKVKTAVDAGFKKIYIGHNGTILVKSNKHGVYYCTRNGKGTGYNLGQYADLRDCTKSLIGNGWGNEITYK